MRDAMFWVRPARRAWAVFALGLVVSAAGCSLGEQTEPALSGPSDQGFNLELTALPDTLNADGVSVSLVRIVVRDENGRPVSGHAVLFEHNGDGVLAPQASSTFVGPIQSGIVMATDNNGVAFVVYTAGLDLRTVTVWARPYGIDAANLYFRSVDIFQR
jgi:hypothetical protein